MGPKWSTYNKCLWVLLTHVYWFRATGGYICGFGRPSNLVYSSYCLAEPHCGCYFQFSHTSDFLPCREQLWDKYISHGFHDLQLCAVYLAWLMCLECKVCEKMHFVWFSMRDGFITTCLRIRPSSQVALVGFGDLWWEKSISHGKPYKIYIPVIYII